MIEPAGFWIRAGARAIDYVVLQIILMFAMSVLGVVLAVAGHPVDEVTDLLTKSTWITWVSSLLMVILYHAVGEGVAGFTIGKRLVGVRVLSEDLTPAGFRQTFLRSCAIVVDGFFLGAVGAQAMAESPIRQRLGDKWGHTRVVLQRSATGLPPVSGGLIAAGMVAAAVTAGELIALGRYLSYLWLTR